MAERSWGVDPARSLFVPRNVCYTNVWRVGIKAVCGTSTTEKSFAVNQKEKASCSTFQFLHDITEAVGSDINSTNEYYCTPFKNILFLCKSF